MSTLVYRIVAWLGYLLRAVPVGTNLGLLHLLLALVSGRFLSSRGAVFPALAAMGLPEQQEATETTEAQFQQRVLLQAGQDLAAEEALIVDAGFALADLLEWGVAC